MSARPAMARTASQGMRAIAHTRYVADLREGRRQRAVTRRRAVLVPRIVTFRLFRLWWACTLDDYGRTGKPRLGFSEDQAIARAAFYA